LKPAARRPPAVREVRFEVDGESVAAKLHEPEGPPAGQLVLVHGLLSQGREFADLPERMASKGYRVLALDQRGFGASGGPRGIITQERATADVLSAVAFLRKEHAGAPVGLVGHSMGAVFALRALAEDPTIRAAVLGAPMLTVRAELKGAEFQMYRVAHALSRVTARTPLGSVKVPYKYDYERLFHSKDAVKRAREDPFLHPTVDLVNYPAFMAMDASRDAPRVRQPVLVILAAHDRAVRRENSLAVYDKLGGPKELVTIPSGHSMWADEAAEAAAGHVERWMTAHLR
jgi:alpha-beta hydrolase superfamily lysophospholipase